MKRRSQRRSKAGFTLLELMVALVAGLIAVTAIYSLSTASARHFHEQQRISQTQMAVRSATELIRRDIQRAGFGGSPNSQRETLCVPPATNFGSIEFLDNFDQGALPNAAANLVDGDRLRLVGNFASSERYFTDTSPAGTPVVLQREWQGFQRSFGTAAGARVIDQDAFQDVFRPGRWVHVIDRTGCHLFAQITNVIPADGSLIFDHGSFEIKRGSLLFPLMRIEYAVLTPSAADANTPLPEFESTAVDEARGTENAVLVRREVGFDPGATPIAGSERVILEYVAEVNYRFLLDTQLAVGGAPQLQTAGGDSDLVANLVQIDVDNTLATPAAGGRPERVRAVFVDLAARTADHSPRFAFVARRSRQEPLIRYQVTATGLAGAARVRTSHAEVFLPSQRILR